MYQQIECEICGEPMNSCGIKECAESEKLEQLADDAEDVAKAMYELAVNELSANV